MNTAVIRHRTVFIFLSLIGILAYLNSFSVPFHFDDLRYLKENPAIRSFAVMNNWLAGDYAALLRGRPLLLLTFALNYKLGGLDTFLYHIVNLMIHISNAFLLYALLYRYAESDKAKGYSPKYLLAAVLFLIHPINTESVTYLSSRSSELSALFALASVFCFGMAVESRFRAGYYLSSILLFLLGLSTKEAVVVVPALLVLFDYFILSKNRAQFIGHLGYHAGFFILISSLFLVYLPYITTPTPHAVRPWTTHIYTEVTVFVNYLRLLFAPVGLNIDPDVNAISRFGAPVVVSLMILSALIVTAVLLRRKQPVVSFGIVWFLMNLAPFLAVKLNDFMAERWVYMASMGFCIAIAELLSMITVMHRKTGLALIGVLFLLASGFSIMRNHVYSSAVILWQDAATKSPLKHRVYANLSSAYRDNGDLPKAIESAEQGIKLGRGQGVPAAELIVEHINLATAYGDQGDYQRAVQVMQSVEKEASGYYEYQHNLGMLLMKTGSYQKALKALDQALAIYPDSSTSLFLAGECYERLAQQEKAKTCFLRATGRTPNNAREYMAQALSYFKLGNGDRGIERMCAAVTADPMDVNMRQSLATILLDNGRLDDAFVHFSALARIAPGFVPAYKGLGQVMLRKGDFARAEKYFRQALDLLPPNSPEGAELAKLLEQSRG